MTITRHGLSIGIERVDQNLFLSLKAIGKLTHQDYQVITPMIDAALKEVALPKIKAIVDITEMQGWELRAAWDDFELGLKHGTEFEKIALYGNKHWQEIAANIGSWFVSGEIKYFEEYQQAIAWLNE
ncbi:MAG: STAS/SEC14 domain-containing protein [Colwellia sp.]|nr:STAS/SEC14 domain-containing protein [Colwellia sp.]